MWTNAYVREYPCFEEMHTEVIKDKESPSLQFPLKTFQKTIVYVCLNERAVGKRGRVGEGLYVYGYVHKERK